MYVLPPKIAACLEPFCEGTGQSAQCADVVPVTVVFGQVTITLVRVVKQILRPGIRHSVDVDLARLKSDGLVLSARELTARAQRDLRLISLLALELLQDLKRRCACIQNGQALYTDSVDGALVFQLRLCRRSSGIRGYGPSGPALDLLKILKA